MTERNYPEELEGFARRMREAIELSKYMLMHGSRAEMIAWGYPIELIEAVLAYRDTGGKLCR